MSVQPSTVRGVLAARLPRSLRRSVVRRIAGWHPPRAAAAIALVGLVVHEATYHATGGADFPLTVLANDHRVFVMSHGGLDAAAVGVLAVGIINLIYLAREWMAHNS